jgi:hypothetical protein
MSPLQANISEALLPDLTGVTVHEKWLNCASEYPWYPLPWLMLATPDNRASIQKAGLWFSDEQRLHWLLHSKPQQDKWLEEQLKTFDETPTTALEEAELQETTPIDEPVLASINAEKEIGIIEPPQPEDYEAPGTRVAASATSSIAMDTDDAVNGVPATETGISEIQEAEEIKPIPVAEEQTIETVAADPASSLASNVPEAINKEIVPLTPTPAPVAEPLAFEPFHSVDYFASQGIKLELPPEPTDKFDRQLKSFTQWLKTMKKVTPQEPSRVTDPVVEAQANASVSGKEIITEAMAQVLEKQGKHQKAVEIYEKLLLLHPEKSAFFAARIEELKNKQ